MRVKRLELQGFKSFKDKTAIHFDAGITGIVGPNGCGKSNIVDAFFWSMGEQNARHLRGSAMEDLIFSGSDKSPAASYAEVTMTLEMPAELTGPNAAAGASVRDSIADGTLPTREVSVTRKLYRSGESEYFLNKTPCRLRDVQELFMDTGVGSRGYSIIQQGQISKIVQAKPEERRTMIEEVAGIVKYKARRKEAARKLEHTQQNLLRLTDVITELESQKRSLERQVDKARKYREWKEKLQSIELRFNALKWEELSDKLRVLELEVTELQQNDAALSAERETVDNIVLTKRIEATSATKVTEENQEKWLRVGQELNQSENDLRFLQRSLEELRAGLANLESDSAREQESLALIQTEVEELSTQMELASAEATSAETTRQELEQNLREKRQQLESTSRSVQDSQRRQLNASTGLAEAEQQAEFAALRLLELSESLARLESERLSREESFTLAQTEKNEATEALVRARGNVEAGRQSLQEASDRTRQTQTDIEESRRLLARLSSEEVTTRSRLNALEEHKRRHENSSQGVQSLFQKILPNAPQLKEAVAGTLADALSVESGFETAVEAALSRHLDLVLTSNYAAHSELTSALKNAQSGRVALADIHTLPAQNTATDFAVAGEGLVGPLSGFVKSTDGNAQRVLTLLANGIYVAADSASARVLAERFPEALFVSKEGELFRGGWFTEGGDQKQVSGAYVGRNREIAELQSKLESVGQELDAARIQLQEREQTLQNLQNERRSLEDALAQAQQQANLAAGEEAGISARLREAERALEQAAQEHQRSLGEQEKLRSQEEDARTRAIQLRSEMTELEAKLNADSETLRSLQSDVDTGQQDLMNARVRETSLVEQKNSMRSKLSGAESSLRERSARLQYLQEQITRKQSESADNVSRSEVLDAAIIELRTDAVSAERNYRESKDRLDILNNEIEQERARAQEISSRESAGKEALTNKRIDFEKLNSERENMAQNTFERYGLTLAEFALSPETIEQVQILRNAGEEIINDTNNEVMLLKEKLRKLGEVNTGAIEEYDQLVERYNFLASQKADLEKSMADLTATIDRINHVSKERFDRAFHQVNENFKRVFPVIFGGGNAHLALTNPDDLVETGVDIWAQPPGKKPQNINLLSGGEKTLTAISLLFAIFLVKPSPFCLLDEVDAPLDDANIGRFNALLREMSKRSQFIIITHNKRTMELNDKLYGVTMEDAGVSKMVSIQLTASA